MTAKQLKQMGINTDDFECILSDTDVLDYVGADDLMIAYDDDDEEE
jgi:hypothetical protein